MPYGRIDLREAAIGIAEIVLEIRIAVITQAGCGKRLDGAIPVASRESPFAGREFRIERCPIRAVSQDPTDEQIGHSRAGMGDANSPLSPVALAAPGMRRAEPLKTYAASAPATMPNRTAMRIGRIMIVVLGLRGMPRRFFLHSRLFFARNALASRISIRSASASVVNVASLRKWAEALSRCPASSAAFAAP